MSTTDKNTKLVIPKEDFFQLLLDSLCYFYEGEVIKENNRADQADRLLLYVQRYLGNTILTTITIETFMEYIQNFHKGLDPKHSKTVLVAIVYNLLFQQLKIQDNMKNNFKDVMEIIGQAIFELPEEDVEIVNNFLEIVPESYVLVQWPESQELMEAEWFAEEAILALGSEDKTGSSAYFIPINRLI